jgi:hypothetical protein
MARPFATFYRIGGGNLAAFAVPDSQAVEAGDELARAWKHRLCCALAASPTTFGPIWCWTDKRYLLPDEAVFHLVKLAFAWRNHPVSLQQDREVHWRREFRWF